MDQLPKAIAVLGPTASGKTELSLRLAKKFNGEIVSADSRAVYKGMDIGTAKPAKRECSAVPHRLINITTPDKPLTLPGYKSKAVGAMHDIIQRKRLPFLVGGTALYLYAVIDNWLIPEIKADLDFRKKLEKNTTKELLSELQRKDPESASMTGANKRRIIRALEVIRATGKKFSLQRAKGPPLFSNLSIGVRPDPDTLKVRIVERTKKMLKNGLLEEVRTLLKHGYSPDLPALSGIHYKEVIEYLNENCTRDEMIARINANDIKLAKHQMKWFKRDKRIKWINDYKEAEGLIAEFLEYNA